MVCLFVYFTESRESQGSGHSRLLQCLLFMWVPEEPWAPQKAHDTRNLVLSSFLPWVYVFIFSFYYIYLVCVPIHGK